MNEELLWCEKFRPKRVKDTILPKELKKTFQAFVNQNQIPNLLLTGPPGSGKTSVAKAVLEETGCDYMFINASLERNIDTLRGDIAGYASSVSFQATRKYVILDEADHLNPNSFQPALRNFIESFSKNCGFILTANYVHKIIDPLHSRFTIVDFRIPKSEKQKLAGQFLSRCQEILNAEKVEFDEETLVKLIMKFFPDWRRILNELQRYSITGKIDSGVLETFEEKSLKDLISHMKEQDFTQVRKWVAQHSDLETSDFYLKMYDSLPKALSKNGIPGAILIIQKYQFESAFSVNPEINIAACLVALMAEMKGLWT